MEQPIGLPPQVLKRSEEVNEKGGSRFIKNSWDTVIHFASNDKKLLQDALDTLKKEEQDDEEMRRVHGLKWTRTRSQELTRKLFETANEFRDKIQKADEANRIVEKKIEQNMYLIENLCMDKMALEASIPASTSASTLALKDRNLIELKKFLNILNENIKKRGELGKRLKEMSLKDDIAPLLLKNAIDPNPKDDESLFSIQLTVFDQELELSKKLVQEQEPLLESIFVLDFLFRNITNRLWSLDRQIK